MSEIDWDHLRAVAAEAAARAYAPYSRFHVGAAALVDDGRIVSGCNVENVSYGLTLCAECGLVSDLHRTGGGRLVAVAIVSGSGRPCSPCRPVPPAPLRARRARLPHRGWRSGPHRGGAAPGRLRPRPTGRGVGLDI